MRPLKIIWFHSISPCTNLFCGAFQIFWILGGASNHLKVKRYRGGWLTPTTNGYLSQITNFFANETPVVFLLLQSIFGLGCFTWHIDDFSFSEFNGLFSLLYRRLQLACTWFWIIRCQIKILVFTPPSINVLSKCIIVKPNLHRGDARWNRSHTGLMQSGISDTRRRVKVYQLNDDRQWDDRGTGHVSTTFRSWLNDIFCYISVLLTGRFLPYRQLFINCEPVRMMTPRP